MKEELKFGIKKADKLIEDFENGDITFLELTCGLWNGGYNACKEDQKIVSQRLMVGSKVCFIAHKNITGVIIDRSDIGFNHGMVKWDRTDQIVREYGADLVVC